VQKLLAHLASAGWSRPITIDASADAPITHVLAFRDGQDWRLVTHGLTRLDDGSSGWGFELALRTRGLDPPAAAIAILEDVARVVARSRGRMSPPETFDIDVPPGGVLVRTDGDIPSLASNGTTIRFLQVVPIFEEDLEQDEDDIEARIAADEGLAVWDPDATAAAIAEEED
jgi:hypothetical protein